jgi:EpsI family protein
VAGVRLSANGADPVQLPAFIGTEWIGRTAEISAVERAILPPDTGFSRRTYVSVQNRSHAVFVSIVLSGRDRTSIHRPEICLVGQGWTISSATAHMFDRKGEGGKSLPVTLLRTSLVHPGSRQEIRAVMAYWFVNADSVVATHWQRFIRDAWNRLRYGRVDRWAYVLVQADAQEGEESALAHIQTILDETLPLFLLAGNAGPSVQRVGF